MVLGLEYGGECCEHEVLVAVEDASVDGEGGYDGGEEKHFGGTGNCLDEELRGGAVVAVDIVAFSA